MQMIKSVDRIALILISTLFVFSNQVLASNTCHVLFHGDHSAGVSQQGKVNLVTPLSPNLPPNSGASAPTTSEHFEYISSIVSGSSIFATISANHKGAGLYKRTTNGWYPVILGEMGRTEHGSPSLTQLEISKIDPKSYALAFVNGRLLLISGFSDANHPETLIDFGSPSSPLFEVGSLQRRLLPKIDKADDISIFQDPVMTSKGSQLVVVSMKIPNQGIFGSGLTFAFEVLPNKEQSKIQLNGRPYLIDYEFHESKSLSNFVTGESEKYLASKILVQQFESSDFSSFGDHFEHMQELVANYAKEILEKLGLKREHYNNQIPNVAFNITTGRPHKDVEFAKNLIVEPGYTVTQKYNTSGKPPQFKVVTRWGTYDLDGQLDHTEAKTVAIWHNHDTGEILFSEANRLHLTIEYGREDHTIDLGETGELFAELTGSNEIPKDLVVQYYTNPKTDKELQPGAIFLSGTLQRSGVGFTGFIPVSSLNGKSFFKTGSVVKLLDYAISMPLLNIRAVKTDSGDILFDSMTPNLQNIASYEQSYDASKPHIDILQSKNGQLKYKFKKATTELVLAPSIILADFTKIDGIESPSGIYYNIAPGEVTGNESTRVLGQVLLNPMRRRKMAPEAKRKPQDYYLASFKLNAPKKDMALDSFYDEEDGTEPTTFEGYKLYAIDASRNEGQSGYKLILFRPHDGPNRDVKDKADVTEIKVSGGTSGDFKNLRGVHVVKGRHEGRTHAFIILSYESEEKARRTIILGFNAAPNKKFEVKTHVLENEMFTGRDLKDRVAFDDNGLPYIKMSTELSPDSYEFSVLNLSQFQIEKPNQAGTNKKRNLKFGDYNGIEQDSRSYIKHDDDWTAWRGDVVKAYPNLGMSGSLAQFDSFVDLGRQLDTMADPNRNPTRMILVVPASLKELVMDYVLNKGYTGERKYGTNPEDPTPVVVNNTFSFSNAALEISIFDKAKASQDQFLANLLYWQKQNEALKKKRNFLIMKFSDLLAATNTGAPQSKNVAENIFQIEDVKASGTDKGLGSVGVVTEKKLPHALYLLAAGGPFGLKEFQARAQNAAASMIIIATPEEMRGIEASAATEVENKMLKHFEIREIKDPDKESMSFSIAEIFAHPEIKSLNFSFSAKEIKAKLREDENFSTIIAYAVSRFGYLTEGKKDSRLEAFMRFRAAFANGVVSDREVRKSRVIDKSFVERILTQVFDIPMNLSTLPKDDPLVILSRPDALLKLQDAGYSGPFSLKAKIRDTLLSQTRADAGKPIPSSTILFGATGAGKTFMFKSLVKMLNLKMYNFNSTDNKDASAIIINVGQVMTEGGSNTEGSLDVSQVIKHLDNFLAQPNGFRGYILFDDIHAANDVVKAKLLSYLRGLFESQEGMYTIKTKEAQFKRPIRNLNLFMTLNPTADQDQISKYAKDKAKPTPEEILLATLSTSEFKIEPSFLRRWGRIINLDFMPAGAKGPELVKHVAKASNDLLNASMKIAIVSPQVIQQLVTQNEYVDARSFLSAATNSLIEVAASDNKGGSLVFVVPTSFTYRKGGAEDVENSASEKITKWVKANTRTLTLNGNLEGSLTFLKMIIDAYRIPLLENMVMALQEDPRFSGDTNLKNTLLAPILLAITHHLKLRPYIALRDINLSASDFGMKTAGERAQFAKVIDEPMDRHMFPLFPKEFKVIDSHTTTWQYIEKKPIQVSPYRRIIADSVQETRKTLEARLSEIMHVSDIEQLPSPEDWLHNLQVNQDSQAGKRTGKALADGLWKFMPSLFARDVQDSLSKENRSISIYSAARLYLSVMDRSIVQMPWVSTSKFLLRSLDEVTQDQVLSQRAGVQSFLFTDPYRLLKPTLSDFVFQIIASAEVDQTIAPETQKKLVKEYDKQYLDFIDAEDASQGVEK